MPIVVSRAGHVAFHVHHAVRRLEAQAAGVERQALAHEHDLLRARLRRLVAHVDEARLFGAAAIDRQQQRHAELLDALLVEHLALDAERLGLGRRDVGERGRGQVVGGAVDEVAREIDGLADGLAVADRRACARVWLFLDEDGGALERVFGLAVPGEVARVAVGTGREPVGQRAQCLVVGRRRADRER